MPKLFLRAAHPLFLIGYQGVIVMMLWTGAASALADPDAGSPPILIAFYEFWPINAWGWVYLAVGVVLVVGLFEEHAARAGLGLTVLFLTMRLVFQMRQTLIIWQDGAPWRELLNTVAGLGILYGFVSCVFMMLMTPFSYVDPTDPDVTVFRTSNGNGQP